MAQRQNGGGRSTHIQPSYLQPSGSYQNIIGSQPNFEKCQPRNYSRVITTTGQLDDVRYSPAAYNVQKTVTTTTVVTPMYDAEQVLASDAICTKCLAQGFTEVTNQCAMVLVMVMVVAWFPLGLVCLMFIPMTKMLQCNKCGHTLQHTKVGLIYGCSVFSVIATIAWITGVIIVMATQMRRRDSLSDSDYQSAMAHSMGNAYWRPGDPSPDERWPSPLGR